MTAVAFDTLRFVRTLRDKAKMPQEQAEGLADAVAEAIQGDLATKGDVTSLKSDIETLRLSTRADLDNAVHKLELSVATVRSELGEFKADTKSEFASIRSEIKLLEQRMTIKLGAMLAAFAGLLIAAIRYLPPAAH